MAYEQREFATVHPGASDQIYFEDLGYGNNTDDRFVIPTSGLASFLLTINDDQFANGGADYASAFVITVRESSGDIVDRVAFVDHTNSLFADAAYELASEYANLEYTVYDDTTEFNARVSPGNGETMYVDIAAALYDDAYQYAGGNAEPISYTIEVSDPVASGGGGGGGVVAGNNGDNTIYFSQIGDYYDGRGGLDTMIFQNASYNYSIDVQNPNTVVINGRGIYDTERLDFTDGTLALDIDGNAGDVYRLYEAAFDRNPDIGGLSFYVDATDGGQSLIHTAAIFIHSPEFRDLYGTNLPNEAFVNELYYNILDRRGDDAGIDWWTDQLDRGWMSRAEVLARFSDSIENRDTVYHEISDGIWLV